MAQPAMRDTPPEFKLVLEPKAMGLLKATSAKPRRPSPCPCTATVSYEYPSKLGPPIGYTSRHDVSMLRPDKLKVVTPGGRSGVGVLLRRKGNAGVRAGRKPGRCGGCTPTIDAALKAAFDTAAIYYPFTDLVVADPYAALTDGALLAFYIGQSDLVGGVKTDMVAWANDDVFLQIWVGADEKLRRRIRAVYRRDPYGLGHQMDLSNWQLDGDARAGIVRAPRRRCPRSAWRSRTRPARLCG